MDQLKLGTPQGALLGFISLKIVLELALKLGFNIIMLKPNFSAIFSTQNKVLKPNPSSHQGTD